MCIILFLWNSAGQRVHGCWPERAPHILAGWWSWHLHGLQSPANSLANEAFRSPSVICCWWFRDHLLLLCSVAGEDSVHAKLPSLGSRLSGCEAGLDFMVLSVTVRGCLFCICLLLQAPWLLMHLCPMCARKRNACQFIGTWTYKPRRQSTGHP